MRAFVGIADHSGLCGLIPEDALPPDLLGRFAGRWSPRPTSVVWALLYDQDAEAIRAAVAAGRHRDACGLLLNRAVELLSFAAATPEFAGSRPVEG